MATCEAPVVVYIITLSKSFWYRMKFKKRQDDVKALQATLKELQGIDPLDYLAK